MDPTDKYSMFTWQRITDIGFKSNLGSLNVSETYQLHGGCYAYISGVFVNVVEYSVFKILNRAINEDKNSTRAHLESQIASAVALNSPDDYQHFLLAYARFLAR